MEGYIGVTSREWFTYLSKKEQIGEVNFWRKNTNNFKQLSIGDPFFFLVKNEKGSKGERAVLGTAAFERFEVLTLDEAWDMYGYGNGDPSKEYFFDRMQGMFGGAKRIEKIGCIILSNMRIFDTPVLLSELNIDFKKSIVSGKYISAVEALSVLDKGISVRRDIVKEPNDTEYMYLTEDDQTFPEGKEMLKLHLQRERNSKVIQLAKQRYLERHGRLFCEICQFNFNEVYGDIGEGYIEAHHTKPISEMKDNDITRIEDIAIVCANCHRMLHRKRPWLSINELGKLYRSNGNNVGKL